MYQGLSKSEVKKRQHKYGKNVLKAVSVYPLWRKLLDQFTDLMVIILIVSAAIAIGMGLYQGEDSSMVDGFVILGIVLINAGIGFFQEYKTEKALEALKKLISPHAIVIRDGKKQQIKAEDVVPGDLIVLSPGDKIVADGELQESSELKADEASLTGESLPVTKEVNEQVFMGTAVVAGAGVMEVTKTGMKTDFGRIAHLTTTTVADKSPLQKELFHIGVFVTKVTIVISGVLILTGIFIQGQSFLDSLLFAVSVAVAAVPEGLPATITVALALGVQKMAKRKAVVKKLSSIETLGSTTVICSDKTGTLTKNEMTVTELSLGLGQRIKVSGIGYDPNKGVIEGDASSGLSKMRYISSYCTEADLQKKGGKYSIVGDPTEAALLTLAQKKTQGDKREPKLKDIIVLEKIPFDSERKLMSVFVQADKTHEIWTKGSPDELLKRCTKVMVDGKVQSFSPKMKGEVKKQIEEMASEALRIIGFAYKPLKSPSKADGLKRFEKDLIFVGMAGMIDPPREAVPNAVEMCHKAGIRTIIITGDHGLTAKAIAKQIGIADEDTPIILGEELEKMTDKQLDKILNSHNDFQKNRSLIFSRVNPEHKCRVVDRLKRQGEIVAVTGDGVNDAPALKRADMGISMGITGTEVSKETADMILLDDSFASIVTAVREGRKVYANLRKFTWFIFSCNIGELVTVFSAIIFQIPAPLTATLILAIDLGTDILPAIALGVDHAEPDVMDQPPRDQKIRIMNRNFVIHFVYLGLFIGAIVVGIYFWKLSSMGWVWGDKLSIFDPVQMHASTLAFTTLVIIQLFNAFNARSFQYSVLKLRFLWQLWASVAASVALVLVIVYLPFFQEIFHTTALNAGDWIIVIGAGVAVLLVEEARKVLIRRV